MRSLGSGRNGARRALRDEMGAVAHRKNVGISGRLQCGGNDELVVATDFKSVEGGQDARALHTGGPYHHSRARSPRSTT